MQAACNRAKWAHFSDSQHAQHGGPGPRVPTTRGLGPTHHASGLRAEEAKPPCAVRTTAQRLQATLHFCPDQRAKGAGSHAGGMQPRQVGALLRLPTRPAWRPRPTRHATGAPDATCEQLHRHPHHYRASSTAEPITRLEAPQRTTHRRQPGATGHTAEDGPAVMAVAGGQVQRSRRQPSLEYAEALAESEALIADLENLSKEVPDVKRHAGNFEPAEVNAAESGPAVMTVHP